MSEEFLKNPTLEDQESVESREKPPRYHTIQNEILEIREDGSKIERALECNNLLHRRCVDEISYDEKGTIIYADQLSREELGPCDCEHL